MVPVPGGDGGVGCFEVEAVVGAALGGDFGFGGVEFFSFSGMFGLDSLIVGEGTLDSFFAGGDAEKFFQFGEDFAGLVTGLGGFDEALERCDEGVAFGSGLVGEVFAFFPVVDDFGVVLDAFEFGIIILVDSSGAIQADGVDSGLVEGALSDGFSKRCGVLASLLEAEPAESAKKKDAEGAEEEELLVRFSDFLAGCLRER